jgi:sugar lactone lactonase YvrE
LNFPTGMAVDTGGNLLIADTLNHRIRKVDAVTKSITTLVGIGTAGSGGDNGPAGSAALNAPRDIAVDNAGSTYIADSLNNRVRKIDGATGTVTPVAGTGAAGFSGDDGSATAAALNAPRGVALDASGNVLIADTVNNRIRKVSVTTGIIATLAGNGQEGSLGDGDPATAANLRSPGGIAIGTGGNLFIADTANHRIRKVSGSSGIITTLAGLGVAGFLGDDPQPAAATALSSPQIVATDSTGNVFVADTSNHRIRKIDLSGVITTAAGSGPSDRVGGFAGDNGPATAARLSFPSGVTVDSSGNLLIADTGNNRIRKVDARSGIISTIAGGGGRSDAKAAGFSGDNGPAVSALLNQPFGINVDARGNLFIADFGNHRIRRVDAATGIITTAAGNGKSSFSGDNGPATAAALPFPVAVKVDAAGNLFIADSSHRIRKVAAATGIITTVAGDGRFEFSGDNGPAVKASLGFPGAMDIDLAGNLLFADTGNSRIRGIRGPTSSLK